jgi:predicted N-acetyltransferase YhbS
MRMTELLPLSGVPAETVENLLDDAFGPDRHTRTAYLLRQGMPVIGHLSFAIFDNDTLAASVQCWPVAVGDASLILVGPVAVASAKQRRGLGHRLMHAMLGSVASGDAPMVMIGDPEYYGRFGFDAEGTNGWTLPGPWEPRRLLLRNPHAIGLPDNGMLGPRTSL